AGDLAAAARAALPAQRRGQLVPGLSRRASGDRSTGRNQARARDRLQLEGRTRRRDALAGAVRQSLLAGTGGLRRPQGDRLGHLRCAGDVPGRCAGHRALEARGSGGRCDAGNQPDARAGCDRGAAVNPARKPAVWLLAALLLAFAGTAQAQAVRDATPLEFRDDAEERRFHDLVAELRCVMCQNQSLADSNAQIAHDLRREVFELMREGRSDAEIRDYLVDRYGEFVLYRPRLDRKSTRLNSSHVKI